jgi:hypothetical protein
MAVLFRPIDCFAWRWGLFAVERLCLAVDDGATLFDEDLGGKSL